jgi:riboflavin synthase
VGAVHGDADTSLANSTARFDVHLIPETQRLTNFPAKQVGHRVNVELDPRTVAIVDTVERVLAERGLAAPRS